MFLAVHTIFYMSSIAGILSLVRIGSSLKLSGVTLIMNMNSRSTVHMPNENITRDVIPDYRCMREKSNTYMACRKE